MAAVLLGLLCAFLIGTANFLGGLVSKRDTSLTIAFVGQVTTVPVMALVLLFAPPSALALGDIAWGVFAGVLQVLGLRLIWQAMSAGKMGLLAAINATVGAVVPAAWAIGAGEPFGIAAVVGSALAFVAIVLIMRAPGEIENVIQHRTQAFQATLSGTCFGVAFIAIAQPATAASVAPLLTARFTGAVVGGTLLAYSGGRYWLSPGNRLGLLPGMFGVASLLLFVVAAHLEYMATVSVVQALAPLFTALLAYVVLRQRLRPLQCVGLAAAFAATVLLAL